MTLPRASASAPLVQAVSSPCQRSVMARSAKWSDAGSCRRRPALASGQAVSGRRMAVKASMAWVKASAPAMAVRPRGTGHCQVGIADRGHRDQMGAGNADLQRAFGIRQDGHRGDLRPGARRGRNGDQRQDRAGHQKLADSSPAGGRRGSAAGPRISPCRGMSRHRRQ